MINRRDRVTTSGSDASSTFGSTVEEMSLERFLSPSRRQQIRNRPQLSQPFWMQQVSLTHELLFQYTVATFNYIN